MIEIFKTNVESQDQVKLLTHLIHLNFPNYQANFDLDDCDKILRIKCVDGSIDPCCLMELLKDIGFFAEVLDDQPSPCEKLENEREESPHTNTWKGYFFFQKKYKDNKFSQPTKKNQ